MEGSDPLTVIEHSHLAKSMEEKSRVYDSPYFWSVSIFMSFLGESNDSLSHLDNRREICGSEMLANYTIGAKS